MTASNKLVKRQTKWKMGKKNDAVIPILKINDATKFIQKNNLISNINRNYFYRTSGENLADSNVSVLRAPPPPHTHPTAAQVVARSERGDEAKRTRSDGLLV